MASVQFNHAAGDKTFNWGRIEHFVREAATQDVELIVFPEMCLTGYWHVRNLSREQIVELAEAVPDGPATERLRSLARTHKMTVGIGLIEKSSEGKLYNTFVVAMPDGRVASHRKIHCFVSEHMSSGDAYTVFDLPSGPRVGILICYDNNLIENVRMTALMGAEILLAPHQTGGCHSPSPRCMGRIDTQLWEDRNTDPESIEAEFRGPKGRDWLMHWLPSRAHDNGLFVIFSNGVGRDDDEVRTGNAMILDPYGDILIETWKAEDAIVNADLDLKVIPTSTGRRWLRTRRPEMYTDLSKSTGQEQDTRTVRFAFPSNDRSEMS